MVSIERPPTFSPDQPLILPEVTHITPDQVRGLSLRQTTQQFGTDGLYLKLKTHAIEAGVWEEDVVPKSLALSLHLHRNQRRTNGPFVDHPLRVATRIVDRFQVFLPDVIAAALLHDTVEDQTPAIVDTYTDVTPSDSAHARQVALEVVADLISPEVAQLVQKVTLPLRPPGVDKLLWYWDFRRSIALTDPQAEVISNSDCDENGVGNHHTRDSQLQIRTDIKQLPCYQMHIEALQRPDSLVKGAAALLQIAKLRCGEQNSAARLLAYSKAYASKE